MASSRCHRARGVVSSLFSLLIAFPAIAAPTRGFVDGAHGSNTALLVGVSHGLSGLDLDLKNVENMVTNPAYNFKITQIVDEKANVADVAKELTQGAADAKSDGTFLFYFTGHGNVGLIWPQDDTMTVEQIRDAIIEGRKSAGPLKRLVLIYDSCHAGSMMDPMRLIYGRMAYDDAFMSAALAANVSSVMGANERDGVKYWEKLMVIASSRADETSLASPDGSIFTLAMKKAFDEALTTHGTVGSFFSKAQEYTKGHHPMARFVPESLQDEPMIP